MEAFLFLKKGFGNRKVAIVWRGIATSVPDPVPDLNLGNIYYQKPNKFHKNV